MLISEVIRLFMRSRERGTGTAKKQARPHTIRYYKRCLEHFRLFMESRGLLRYEDVKRSDMREFVDYLHDQEWSEATLLLILRALRALFKFVENDEDCQEDIEGGLKSWKKVLPRIGKAKPRSFIPTPDQLRKFKNGFVLTRRDGYRDFVAASLLLDTGMRVGELCLLKLDNLKLDDRTLVVPEGGKTGTRLVPIRQDLIRLMKIWLRKRERIVKDPNNQYVFVNREGVPCQPNTFNQSFKKCCGREGLPNITPHTLRHAFCTYYLRGGGDIAKLKLITGHTSYDILNDYLHLAEVGGNHMQEDLEKASPLKQIEARR